MQMYLFGIGVLLLAVAVWLIEKKLQRLQKCVSKHENMAAGDNSAVPIITRR